MYTTKLKKQGRMKLHIESCSVTFSDSVEADIGNSDQICLNCRDLIVTMKLVDLTGGIKDIETKLTLSLGTIELLERCVMEAMSRDISDGVTEFRERVLLSFSNVLLDDYSGIESFGGEGNAKSSNDGAVGHIKPHLEMSLKRSQATNKDVVLIEVPHVTVSVDYECIMKWSKLLTKLLPEQSDTSSTLNISATINIKSINALLYTPKLVTNPNDHATNTYITWNFISNILGLSANSQWQNKRWIKKKVNSGRNSLSHGHDGHDKQMHILKESFSHGAGGCFRIVINDVVCSYNSSSSVTENTSSSGVELQADSAHGFLRLFNIKQNNLSHPVNNNLNAESYDDFDMSSSTVPSNNNNHAKRVQFQEFVPKHTKRQQGDEYVNAWEMCFMSVYSSKNQKMKIRKQKMSPIEKSGADPHVLDDPNNIDGTIEMPELNIKDLLCVDAANVRIGNIN
jgi:hypothetical protein